VTEAGEQRPVGALIAIFLILLGTLVVALVGSLLSIFLMDAPSRSTAQEIGRWIAIVPLWLAPFMVAWAVFQNVLQLLDKAPVRFLPLLLWPSAAAVLAMVGYFVGMILWNL
jgi:hypothetical protein